MVENSTILKYLYHSAEDKNHESRPNCDSDTDGHDNDGEDDVFVDAYTEVGGETGKVESPGGRHCCHGAHGEEDSSCHHEGVEAAQTLRALDAPHLVGEEGVQEDCDDVTEPPEWQLNDEVVEGKA